MGLKLWSAYFICRVVYISIVCLIAGFAVPANSAIYHDSQLTWQTLHSPNFRVHFHNGLEVQAKNVAAIAENVHGELTEYFSWQTKSVTDIVLMDEVDFANGFATPIPANRIVLWLTPPDDGRADYGPWLETLITHEYVHTLHLDKVEGSPAFLQSIFGRHPLLFPGIFQPSWLIEGLATLLETDEVRGVGRGQSSYFDMLMRVEVLNGFKPLKQVNQPIASWPAGRVNYLYGVEFYKYLIAQFGEEDVKRFVDAYSANLIPARVNSTFRRIFNKNLEALWLDFEQVQKTRYSMQKEAIVRAGAVVGQRISDHGYQVGKLSALPQGGAVYVRQDGKSQAGLFLKSTEGLFQSERLLDLNGMANVDVSSIGEVIIAQPERINNAMIYYDLYRYDLGSKVMVRLTQGKRYRYAAWNPAGDRLIAVRFSKGQHTLDLLNRDGELIKNIWQGESGEIVSHIDWSPTSEQVVATVWRPKQGWNIELLSLADGSWQTLTQDASIQLQPSFSLTGGNVIFSADYDGVYNIYQVNLASKRVSQLTNVIAGAFNPSYGLEGVVYYTGYHSDGYDIYQLDSGNTLLERTVTAAEGATYIPQKLTSLDDVQWSISSYQPQDRLLPTWWSPILAIEEHTVIAGLMTSGSDPLNRHNYALSLGGDSESGALFGGLSYSYDRWFPVANLIFNRSIGRETDNTGTLLKVRVSDFFQASLDFPFLSLQQQWAFHSALVVDKERDGYINRPQARTNDLKDGLIAAGASYNSTRKYPLSISVTDGRLVSLRYEDSDLVSSDYQGQAFVFDWREYLSLGNEHVLAMRGVFAEAGSGAKRFELGGSDSEFFTSSVGMVFNQRDFPLRGYTSGLPSLRGNKARFYGAEWRFPIKRIERGGMSPPIGLDQISGAIFYDVGNAWYSGRSKGASRSGSGIEINGDSYLLYRFPVRFRLGYARGHDEGGEDQFYLRLGSSF